MDHLPSIDLLEATHRFPGLYQFKAIGNVEDDFEARVLEAVRAETSSASDVQHSARTTPRGRHVSVTLQVAVDTPEQVRTIYARLQEVQGLTLLL
jgi:putative lipoic acid-binding regulatory protein